METLQKAILVAIKDTLDITLVESSIPLCRSFASKISLDSRYFIIVTNKPLLKKFAFDFLGDLNPTNDMLIDISKEITNIIIGKAKVLYSQNNKYFKLGIPLFLGNKAINRYSNAIHYRCNNIRCSIYEV